MPSDDEPDARPPKKREGFNWIRLFFLPFLLGGIAVFWAITIYPLWRGLKATSWERTPCTILESELASEPGDETALYRVKITYRYEFRGEFHTSTRFNFDTGTSSTHDWKAKVVADLPADSKTECFVNPQNPDEAVLERAPRAEIWFGLLGLPFIAVGCLTFMKTGESKVAKQRRKAAKTVAQQQKRPTPVERVEHEIEIEDEIKPGWRVLKPAASRGQYALIITGAAIFWNAITWAVLLPNTHSGHHIQWGAMAFASVFVLGGVLLAGVAVHRILSMFNPTLRVSMEKSTLRLGGLRGLEWEFQGPTHRIRTLTVTLEGLEEATYTRGTTTTTERRLFLKEELFTNHDPLSMARGAAQIRVPADSMHSFAGSHNAIVWVVRLRGEIPMFPDVNDEFPISVGPLDHARGSQPLPSHDPS